MNNIFSTYLTWLFMMVGVPKTLECVDQRDLFFLSVVNKAGKHMEDTLIASYLTLIIGHLILEEKVLYTYSSYS